jgi:hypothetical protein
VPVLIDTGVLYAYFDRQDAWHDRAARLLHVEAGGLVLPSPVIPEVDHLLGERLGRRARATFYRGLLEDAYFVVDVPRPLYARVDEIHRRFPALNLGFVDAAVAALAESLEVRRIATTDRRDFVPLAAAFGFELLP